jgi:uncharacterized protein involved in cysteine biosynthesis
MKRDRIQALFILLLLGTIFFLIFRYFNLSVSEKYETQLEGLNATKEQLKHAVELKNQIEFQKKITVYSIIICLILFFPIVLLKKKF